MFFILNLPLVATCSENQIDINSASLEELDALVGIGPVKAQAIIDARPFESLNDLIKVYGIGEVTLENIKGQGLACVEGENSEEKEDDKEIFEEDIETIEENEKEIMEIDEKEPVEREVISLNPKVIKSEETEENLGKNKYAVYGLVGFCILVGVLFYLKQRKPKNEFKE